MNDDFLSDPSDDEKKEINEWIDKLNEMDHTTKGLISKHYSPKDDENIQENERTFYTNQNAMIIDSMMVAIKEAPQHLQKYLLASLLVKSSIHTNTSGVFKGFHKKDSIGHFGGKKDNCLTRICGKIVLDYPLFSQYKTNTIVYQKDIVKVELPQKVDITYYDPPYNQHPYGSNYFMLNLITTGEMKKEPQGVSGILEWNRSDFNYKKSAINSFKLLLKNTNSRYIIISYNNEGIISENEWLEILSDYEYEKKEIEYNAYKGSRNLKNRSNKVREIFWIIDKTI